MVTKAVQLANKTLQFDQSESLLKEVAEVVKPGYPQLAADAVLLRTGMQSAAKVVKAHNSTWHMRDIASGMLRLVAVDLAGAKLDADALAVNHWADQVAHNHWAVNA